MSSMLWVSIGLFSQLSLCACHASAIRHKTAQIMIFLVPFCLVALMSAMLHLSGCTHKPYASIFVCKIPNTLLFGAGALKQANSACVCRYRCPLSVIEDDEEAAHVRGYCSWTTYKSKRQSFVIDDVFCRIRPYLNGGFSAFHSTLQHKLTAAREILNGAASVSALNLLTDKY